MAQQVEPVADISGVPQLAGYAEMRAQKRGGKFRDQLLGGICARAEATREVAVETGLVSRPMAELVKRRPRSMASIDLKELAGGMIDEVERRDETGLVAAVPDVGFRCRDEGVNGCMPLGLGRERGFGEP